ncbi:hypothetical protein ACOMHN_039686 [Nucella lapillus]
MSVWSGLVWSGLVCLSWSVRPGPSVLVRPSLSVRPRPGPSSSWSVLVLVRPRPSSSWSVLVLVVLVLVRPALPDTKPQSKLFLPQLSPGEPCRFQQKNPTARPILNPRPPKPVSQPETTWLPMTDKVVGFLFKTALSHRLANCKVILDIVVIIIITNRYGFRQQPRQPHGNEDRGIRIFNSSEKCSQKRTSSGVTPEAAERFSSGVTPEAAERFGFDNSITGIFGEILASCLREIVSNTLGKIITNNLGQILTDSFSEIITHALGQVSNVGRHAFFIINAFVEAVRSNEIRCPR